MTIIEGRIIPVFTHICPKNFYPRSTAVSTKC